MNGQPSAGPRHRESRCRPSRAIHDPGDAGAPSRRTLQALATVGLGIVGLLGCVIAQAAPPVNDRPGYSAALTNDEGDYGGIVSNYQGDRIDQLTPVASDDDSGGNSASRVTFLAAKGRTFHIAVAGKGIAQGTIVLRLTEDPIASPPIIDRHPISLAVTNGQTAIFTVEAHGSPDLAYQWTKDAVPIPGATAPSLVLTNVHSFDEGTYRVTIRNEYPPETNSYIARLTFGAILRGQVTDATNRKPIAGAKVCAGEVCAFTDESGNYELVGVEPTALNADFYATKTLIGLLEPTQLVDQSTANTASLRCTHANYIDFEDSRLELLPGQSLTNTISLAPALGSGLRFVLNWGREPADLDLILLGVTDDRYWFRFDWHAPANGLGSTIFPYVTFDGDAVHGFGPESVTIHRLLPAWYQVYVSKAVPGAPGSLAQSQATVRTYGYEPALGVGRTLGTVTVPSDQSGDYWHVCTVDGHTGQVVWVNRLSNTPPVLSSTTDVGSSLIVVPPESVPPPVSSTSIPTHPILTYRWSLGDGRILTNREAANVVYSTPGCYDLSLTVSGADLSAPISNTLTRPCYITVTNGAPDVRIVWPPDRRLFRTGDPVPFEILAVDTDRVLAARRIVRTELYEVVAGRTNLVGTLTNSLSNPVQFSTTLPGFAEVGLHTFVARSTDNHDASTWSQPVVVEVRKLDGDILILHSRPDPEIDALVEELTRSDMEIPALTEMHPGMGRRSPLVRSLAQEGLHFDLVRGFRLILWDDCGLTTEGLTANTAAVLNQAWRSGIPLYLIGENLVADAARFTEPSERDRWFELVGLAPGGVPVGPGLVVFESGSDPEPFFTAWYGDVAPFVYPRPLHPGKPYSLNSEVLATREHEPVLLRQPSSKTLDVFHERRMTQNLLVAAGDEPHSRQQRRLLLRNAIVWLLRADCDAFAVASQLPTPAVRARRGEDFVLAVWLDSSGPCAASQVVVSSELACGLEVVGTELISRPEAANPAQWERQGRTLRAGFSTIAPGSSIELRITLRAREPGTYINRVTTTANYRPAMTQEQTVVIEGAPSAGPGSTSTGSLGLRFRLTADGLVLCAADPSLCDAQLEESADLASWRSLGDAAILGCDHPCSDPLPTTSHVARFFRLRCR